MRFLPSKIEKQRKNKNAKHMDYNNEIRPLQKDNIEGWFNIKEYQGKIVGYKQLIKDSTNNFSLEINRGYIFEDSDKSDFSKKRFQKSETSKNYYKGFGQIKIYALDDADKLYQLACKQYNNKKLFIGSFLSIPTAPIFAIIFTKYIDTGINISFFAPFIPILVGYYLATKSSNKEQQISSRIREIKPIYQGSDAINELSRIYGISL